MGKSEVIEAIKRYDKYLIVSHIGLEGDSIGSQFAFKALIEKMGKKGTVVSGEKSPLHYDFMGVKDEIVRDLKKGFDYEAVAVLDCPVTKRVGKPRRLLEGRSIINIDHHISNVNFGDANWVEPQASSAGEMIYELHKDLGIEIDQKTALYIYVAIVTDTGSFAYECTGSKTHAIVSELIEKGLRPHIIYQKLYENRSIAETRLLKDALSTMALIKDKPVAYMHVSKEMLKKEGLGLDATEGFINYARSIKEAEVAVIFLEDPNQRGQIQISLRSKGGIDVNKLAALFDGGGHKNASGCVVRGALKDVMKRVLAGVGKAI